MSKNICWWGGAGGVKVNIADISMIYEWHVVDPYHFDTDPEPGAEQFRYGSGSGSRPLFDTDPDPGKNDTDPIPGKKRFNTLKIFKIWSIDPSIEKSFDKDTNSGSSQILIRIRIHGNDTDFLRIRIRNSLIWLSLHPINKHPLPFVLSVYLSLYLSRSSVHLSYRSQRT